MTNPFNNINYAGLQSVFNNAISSLLNCSGCAVTCTLEYGVTKYENCVNCWEAGTLIKTINGFKPIEQILIGEEIFSSSNTINIVEDMRYRIYDGVLYNIASWSCELPQRVTANHKFPIVRNMRSRFTQKQWYDKDFILNIDSMIEEVEAKDISIDDGMIIPYTSSTNHDLDEWHGITLSDDVLYLFGWWLAEGCLNISNPIHHTRAGSFCLCASDEEVIAYKLKNILLNIFNLHATLEYRDNADNLLVNWYSVDLAKIMMKFGHLSYNKHIPNDLYNKLSLRQKMLILQAYHMGDGHVCNRLDESIYDKYSICTTSQILSMQIFDILIESGYNPSINWKEEYTDKNNQKHRRSFIVHWQNDRIQQKSNVRKTNLGYLVKVRKIEETYDIINVYNLQVRNEHKYIANGIWTNNCVYDPIGQKSSNRHLNGGPIPFPFGGLCPVCNGIGKRPVVTTEDVDLIVVYDPRDFIQFSQNTSSVNNPSSLMQTMSKIELMPKLQTAKSIKVSKDIEGYFNRTYERVQEPMPCGFGASAFAVCTWKRI